ncbi:GFA family protein [Vitiosangium sp. GDMCC 1.1324]|uniref:GFA family protein n=1 Tax=Vitiosangium sp. (strain GDMCC 1.1324) TaxID=2138576 RepID=UPI0018EE8A55|nr:GFA family protein [Vitiosangium sp. GDMCC 1.1324]
MTATTIQCHCGAVRIELTGEPLAQGYCHCDDCQAAHVAAYVPFAMYRIPQTRIVSGSPGQWKRKTTPRFTCRDCGTRLFAEPLGLGIRGVSALLLPQGMFKPAFHMQCQYALLPIQDELPHY